MPEIPGRVWRDHLIMLLHIAAATEHALMVQYLYAAYSLNLEQKRDDWRTMVARWQKSILAVAKEEMGHLLTVQNILTLLGGPINLDREDFPWDAPYYPFPFRLEPLTMRSLSCYVYAEMPEDSAFDEPGVEEDPRYRKFKEKEEEEIKERVREAVSKKGNRRGTGEHRVGALYELIIKYVKNARCIPDSAFQESTFSLQASWDDWGRGYQPDPRLLDARGDIIEPDTAERKGRSLNALLLPPSGREAHVMIDRVATRGQVIEALRRIGGQGEAAHLAVDETGEPSHFERFLEIYQEFEELPSSFNPSHKVAVNPGTRPPEEGGRGAHIEDKHSCNWAHLFNLRYRMLLTYLAHTFRLARITRADEPSVRAVTMHRVFGEMYNLKTIAGILVRLPLNPGKRSRAGPPFEIPYSLRLPPTEPDAWRLQRDLLLAADRLCDALLPDTDGGRRQYLRTMKDLDRQSLAWIDRALAGLDPTGRRRV